jgi:hypothetical protein
MMNTGFADILCPDHNLATGCNAAKERGTLVQIGVNRGVIFEIVAIEGDTAWIREPVTYRNEALIPLARLRVAYPALG